MIKGKNIAIVATAIYILSFVFKDYVFNNGLRPMGLATVFILPALGALGVFLSIREKNIITGLINLALVFSFYLTMWAGYGLHL